MSAEKVLNKFAIKNVFTISEDASVEEALRALNEHGHRAAPVIDDNGIFKGMFSTHEVIKSLLPSYLMGSEMNLDFALGLSPHFAAKLREIFPSKVKNHVSLHTDFKLESTAPSLEALRILTKYGSPIPLVDGDTGQLKGLISDQSAIAGLLAVEAEYLEDEN